MAGYGMHNSGWTSWKRKVDDINDQNDDQTRRLRHDSDTNALYMLKGL